jgi:Ca2+-binding EF-hand superfamily protein
MVPDALVPASRLPEPLPAVELAAPERVISDRLAEIRRDRAHVRAERVPLDEIFTPEELEALRVAFGRVDVDETGEITLEELPRAFEQVGMQPTEEELARLLEHLNKRSEPETTLTFAEFSQAADFLSPLDDMKEADSAGEL